MKEIFGENISSRHSTQNYRDRWDKGRVRGGQDRGAQSQPLLWFLWEEISQDG